MGGQNQKDRWDKFNIFVPIISALLLIGFGAMASTSIQDAIKERQVEVYSGQAMQELLTLLMSKETKFDKFEASAYALAAFGPVAALPLIKVIDTHSDYKKRNVARDALLLQASLGNSKTACAALTIAIGKHSKVFNWKTHQSAIELIGSLKCEGAVEEIEDYLDFFKKIELAPSGDLKKHSLEVMKTITREHEFEELNQEQIDKGILNLCNTIKNLDRLQKRTREEKDRCPADVAS
ncbi:MAG: hypothetical protein GXO96_12100 [Nitrospirae bacterium]|nr:hypothetical protein [Candidatus Manganitrophaceae bacterium]